MSSPFNDVQFEEFMFFVVFLLAKAFESEKSEEISQAIAKFRILTEMYNRRISVYRARIANPFTPDAMCQIYWQVITDASDFFYQNFSAWAVRMATVENDRFLHLRSSELLPAAWKHFGVK